MSRKFLSKTGEVLSSLPPGSKKKKKLRKLEELQQQHEAFMERKRQLTKSIDIAVRGVDKEALLNLLKLAQAGLGVGDEMDFARGSELLDQARARLVEANRLATQASSVPSLAEQKRLRGQVAVDGLLTEMGLRGRDKFNVTRQRLGKASPQASKKTVELLAALEKSHEQVLADVRQAIGDGALNARQTLPDFGKGLDGLTRPFTLLVDRFIVDMDQLASDPGLPPEKQIRFLLDHETEPDVARAIVRSDRIQQEVPRLESALSKLEEQLKALKARRRSVQDLAGKKELETEYAALEAQKARLGGRLAQLKGYRASEEQRFDTMILLQEEVETLQNGIKAKNKALLAQDYSAFGDWQAETKKPGFSAQPGDALEEGYRIYLEKFNAAAARVLRGQPVVPGEPPVTEISSTELAVLVRMLRLSQALAARGEYGLATAAQNEANVRFVSFGTARKNALPPVPEPPLDVFEVMRKRLGRLEPLALDLLARRYPQADMLEEARAKLLVSVEDESIVPAPKSEQLQVDVQQLAERFEKARRGLESMLPPMTPQTIKAQDTGARVNQALLGLYETEKIKDTSLIEDPTAEPGKDGPPKGRIPLGQVITVMVDGQPEQHRILNKTTGGKDVDRRDKKTVPREMLALLRGRAETLQLMADNAVAESADALDAFATETTELLEQVTSREGKAAYEQTARLVEKIDAWLVERPLDKYLPEGLAQAKKELADFKTRSLTMSPAAALAEAQKLHQRFGTLRERGTQLRSDYRALGGAITGIQLELTSALSEAGLGDGTEIGARMGRLFNGGALELARKSGDLALVVRIEKVQLGMKNQIKDGDAQRNQLEGKWRNELENAWRMKEGLTETAIGAAGAKVGKLRQEIDDFHGRLNGRDKLKGRELVEFLTDLALRMEDADAGARRNTELDEQWKTGLAATRKAFDELDRHELGGGTNGELLKARRSGLKARIEATEKEVKKMLDRAWGVEQMADILRQIRELAEDAGEPKLVQDKVADIQAGPRGEAVVSLMARFKLAAAELAGKVRARADDGQKPKVEKAAVALANAMARIAGLPDGAALATLCSNIDKGRDEAPEARRIQRENALAELRRLRGMLNGHPAVQLYRGNPVDGGRVLPLLLGALHRVEVGILVSVDPKA